MTKPARALRTDHLSNTIFRTRHQHIMVSGVTAMPMIDIYAATGTFPDTHKMAVDAAAIVREVEQVPDIRMFRQNTAAFVHEMPPGTFANLNSDNSGRALRLLERS
jgi:hypothetical protein